VCESLGITHFAAMIDSLGHLTGVEHHYLFLELGDHILPTSFRHGPGHRRLAMTRRRAIDKSRKPIAVE